LTAQNHRTIALTEDQLFYLLAAASQRASLASSLSHTPSLAFIVLADVMIVIGLSAAVFDVYMRTSIMVVFSVAAAASASPAAVSTFSLGSPHHTPALGPGLLVVIGHR